MSSTAPAAAAATVTSPVFPCYNTNGTERLKPDTGRHGAAPVDGHGRYEDAAAAAERG